MMIGIEFQTECCLLLVVVVNAACLHNAFFTIDFCKCFLFSCFVLVC